MNEARGTVDITLSAIDHASGKIKSVEKALKGVGGTSSTVAKPLNFLSNLLAGGWSTVGAVINIAIGIISTIGRVAGSVFNAITSIVQNVISSVSALASKLMSVAGILGGLFAAAVTKITYDAVKLAGSFEQITMAFTTMMGSAGRAKNFLSTLLDFSKVTPFQFFDLASMTQKMMAFGFTAQQILPTLTAIGNAVSGLGGNADVLNRVIVAFGQIKAKGRLMAQEVLQLTEAGIGAYRMLAQSMGTSIANVMQMGEQGLISADTAIKAIIEGMNREFPGMMEKQSKTFLGKWSNMIDSIQQALMKLGEPIIKALSPVIGGLTAAVDYMANSGMLDKIGSIIASWFSPESLSKVINWFANLYKAGVTAISWISDKWGRFTDWYEENSGKLLNFWANFMDWGGRAIDWIKIKLMDVWNSPAMTVLKFLVGPSPFLKSAFNSSKTNSEGSAFPSMPKYGDVLQPGALKYIDYFRSTNNAIKTLSNPTADAGLVKAFKDGMAGALDSVKSPLQQIADATSATANNTAVFSKLDGRLYGGGEQSKLAIQRFLFGGAAVPSKQVIDIRISGGSDRDRDVAKQTADAFMQIFNGISATHKTTIQPAFTGIGIG